MIYNLNLQMFLPLIISLLIANFQGNVSTPCNQLKIQNRFISWGHKKISGTRKIEAIIIHSSYNVRGSDSFDINAILKEYRQINVSPHYIIDRHGTIYKLVNDRDIAYHAGKSRLPDGITDVNEVSIGIELVNTESDSPTEEQYISLMNLVKCLEKKYEMKYILGHSDIAPRRKTDPWNFDWQKFSEMLKLYGE